MEFLAPLMLVGLAGASVPLIIHLIGRRRAPVKRFGAIDFLLGTNRRVARRLRLRETILLCVRILSCLALPLVIAKPFVSCTARGLAVPRGPQAAVLLIDNSFTMGYRHDGGTLLAEAKARARTVLDELGPEADVAVGFTAEGAEPPGELSRDHIKLRDAIGEAPLSTRPADLSAALRRAAALVATSPHAARRVYLFSALTAGELGAGGEAPWAGDTGTELHVVPIGEPPLTNLALVGARADKEPDIGPRGVRITAEIQNFGPSRVADRGVTLWVGGKSVSSGLISLDPGERVAKRFSTSLPADARASEVVVALDDDGLAVDDRRYLRVELRRDVHVLLVDGDPRTVRRDDETFYLETALRPGDRGDSSLAVTPTTVDELGRRRLADFDVIFLCNVPPLEPQRVADLEAWVKKGGGLFVALGDNVDGDAYNASMQPLLAQELHGPRVLAQGAKGDDAGRAERVGRFDADHPTFQVFSAEAAGLREARFWKIFLLGTSVDSEERRTLASFSGGAPALVERRLGSGHLLLWTSTLDRDWNDLPIHPGYLPFVQQAARYLARAPSDEPEGDLLVGRSHDLPVGPEDARVEITSPSGKKTLFEQAKLSGRTSVSFGDTGEPGFYHIVHVAANGAPRAGGADFVVNVDPRGSDTRKPSPEWMPASSGQTVAAAPGAAPGSPRRRVELWHGLAAALLLFLFGEAALTRRG